MERKLDSQPNDLVSVPPQHHQPRIPLALLFFLMLLPWLWIWIGLTAIKDYRITILTYELLGCLVPAILLKPKRLSLLPFKVPSALLMVMYIALTNVVILTLFKFSHGFHMNWAFFYQQTHGVHLLINGYFWLFTSYFVILNPLFEELFWRGIVYHQWKLRLPVWQANLVSSFFFGAWHWQVLHHFCQPTWALILTGMVMIGGVIFAYTYEKAETLGASVLLHSLGADFPLAFVVYDCILYSTHLFNTHPLGH